MRMTDTDSDTPHRSTQEAHNALTAGPRPRQAGDPAPDIDHPNGDHHVTDHDNGPNEAAINRVLATAVTHCAALDSGQGPSGQREFRDAVADYLTAPIGDNHTYINDRLTPGVWPKRIDRRGHFQVVGTNQRSIVIGDLGGAIDLGGVDVEDPAALDEAAARLRVLADRLRQRQAAT